MVESYAQHDDAQQAFHKWRLSSEARLPGIRGPDFETTCFFIPRSNLKDYFERPRRVENLLDAVLNDHERPAVDANYVRDHYLQSFATLLCIGEGRMIHHFQQHKALRDQKLPYRTRPDEFPTTTPDKFEDFKEAQWQFCASDLEYGMNDRFKEEEILPLILKEKIGEGGSAIIYKIVVDEGYNSLRPHGHILPDRRRQFQNTFVLKTYRPAEAEENYKAERDAYMKLRWAGKPSPHIIAYYGGFVHGSSYNIILEYADQGTLESFMKITEPPSTIEDTLLFWDRLSCITHGIMTIHGKIGNDSSASQLLNGWHQDVKPANILVFSGNGTSPYDCHFKIADLGLTHFKPSVSQPIDPSDLDAFGTRAYGAPETFRSHLDTESSPLQVSQAVDIWSIGCVFSEASVWAHDGGKRVVEYRRQRSAEIEASGGGEGEHSFHYDGEVLHVVKNIHKDMLERNIASHHITRSVLDRLVNDMLQHETRPQAKWVFEKSKRLIKECGRRFGVTVDGLVGTTNGEPFLINPKGSPQIPLEHIQGPSESPSGRHNSSRKVLQDEPLPPDVDCTPSSSSSRSQSTPHGHHPNSMSQSSNGRSIGAVKTSKSDREGSQGVLDPLPPPSAAANTHGHLPNSMSQSSNGRSIGAVKTSKSDREGSQGVLDPLPPPSAAANTHSSSAPQHMRQSPDELVRPTLSVEEGHDWKKKKKDGIYVNLHGSENMTTLDQRDHIFIIDNSATMGKHINEIERVISLLAYILKKSDKDGLDLYFTQTTQKVNSQKSSKLSSSINQASFSGISDMRGRLQSILKEHIQKFGEQIFPPKPLFGRQPPPRAQRPLSFYILTDAKWQPTDVGGLIKDLVQRMIAKNCPKEHVAIQFIRFGSNETSIIKLDELDHGLGLKDIGMDIVDHTYWDGNVWKQLLGPLNDWYDDDPP